MSSAADAPTALRDACLRAALRAYPSSDRASYGSELVAAASDLAAGPGSSTTREVAGLLRGGAAARLGRFRRGLLAFDRTATLASLPELLCSMVAAVWGAAAIGRMMGRTGAAAGATVGSIVLLAALAVLVLAVARRQRYLATTAAVAVLVQVVLSASWAQWRGDVVTAAPRVHLHVGPWWFGPSLAWSLVPLVVLLVPACWAMTPAPPRVPGLRVNLSQSTAVRFVIVVAPAVVAGIVLAAGPQLLLAPVSGEMTELPGLLFLMIAVGALWLATSSLPGRDHWSAAGALVGLAAAPSIAYGFAGLITPGVASLPSAPLRLGIVLGIAALTVLLTGAVFLSALSRVGMRRLEAGATT